MVSQKTQDMFVDDIHAKNSKFLVRHEGKKPYLRFRTGSAADLSSESLAPIPANNVDVCLQSAWPNKSWILAKLKRRWPSSKGNSNRKSNSKSNSKDPA